MTFSPQVPVPHWKVAPLPLLPPEGVKVKAPVEQLKDCDMPVGSVGGVEAFIVTANVLVSPSPHALLGVTVIVPPVVPTLTVILLPVLPPDMSNPPETDHVLVTPDAGVDTK
jgi:hypothetical protein